MSWSIGFFQASQKMGYFHFILQEKSQKISLTVLESQILPNLQNLDINYQISNFEWTLHNG